MNSTPMHEFYLAAIVALSLVLPLIASAWAPPERAGMKRWMQTVWAGQATGAVGGLLVILSPLHPACGLAVAIGGCVIFGWLLRRQLCAAQGADAGLS